MSKRPTVLPRSVGGGTQRAPRTVGSGRAAWLLMTGDQIYADDVAGPMLAAIDFDDNLFLETCEVDDIAINRNLKIQAPVPRPVCQIHVEYKNQVVHS